MPIGYTFGNYSVEDDPNFQEGHWGRALTADDMRSTYLFGIDLIANDNNQSFAADEQLEFFIDQATTTVARSLTIDIEKRIYITPSPSKSLVNLKRGRKVGPGIDYTDIEDTYEFNPEHWRNFGFINLRHKPLISIQRAQLNTVVQSEVIDLVQTGWLRPQYNTGQLRLYPTRGVEFGPFAIGALPWRFFGAQYPDGYEIDYTTGFESAEFIPEDLRGIIGKVASITTLLAIGDGLFVGLSSRSIGLDGLTESLTTTQNPTNPLFGGRIIKYAEEIEDWLERNRYKYGGIPVGFIGI